VPCDSNHFRIYGDHFPGLVLEVANSARYGGRGKLARRLHNIIIGSDSKINVALSEIYSGDNKNRDDDKKQDDSKKVDDSEMNSSFPTVFTLSYRRMLVPIS
jgi:hypothetical protein